MTYHLNLKWKIIIIGGGVVSCLFGLAFFPSIFSPRQTLNGICLLSGIGLAFLLMGIEMIYEGINTKIELLEDEIIYYQSRYIFSASWQNLQNIMPSPGALVLIFSESKKIRGGIIYKILKSSNMHSSLAINYYLTNENKEFIKEKIIAGLKVTDQNDVMALNKLIQP